MRHWYTSLKKQAVFTTFLFVILMAAHTSLNAQWITGVNPDEGMQGETLDLVISGQSTHFLQATSVSVNLQQGTATIILPQEIGYMSNEVMQATFSFSFNHDPGIYDLRVSNDIDGTMFLYDAFEILENPIQPELVGVQPDEAFQGEALDLIISGQNTHFQASTTTVALKQGTLTILPQYRQVISDTEISAHFAFAYFHPTGLYDVQTDNEIDGTLTLPNAFTLQPGDVPTILGIEPANATNGTMYQFDVYGENTHFVDAFYMTAILYNEAKEIISLEFDILSNTHLQGTIILPYTSSPGYWHINILNNIDGSIDLLNALYLEENSQQPEILSLEPDSAYQGDVVQVNAFTQNTWFGWAQTLNAYLKKTGSSEYVPNQGILIINDEELKVNFEFLPYATPGYYDMYITDNLDGQIVGTDQFYIIDTITGIGNLNNPTQVSVYPNPANDYLYISSGEYLQNCKICINNLTGQEVELNDIDLYKGIPVRINITKLPKGLYFIKIVTEEKMIYKKIIKH
jgi:hypothetical protein